MHFILIISKIFLFLEQTLDKQVYWKYKKHLGKDTLQISLVTGIYLCSRSLLEILGAIEKYIPSKVSM